MLAISKEARWMKGTGIILQFFGLFAIIPFKAEYLQFWDLPFYSISGIGVLLLLRATQKIGWRLNLENNILYYSKFNYYSSWKKRRSNEFALSIEKITKVEMDGKDFVISYNQSKKLRFNTSGLSSLACLRLEKLKTELESDIVRRINA